MTAVDQSRPAGDSAAPPVLGPVLAIALPVLLASLASLVAPLLNTAVIGRHDPAYLYPLALVLPMILLQNSVNESLRVASVAFAAQASGSGDLDTYARRQRTVLVLGVAVNLGVALLFLVAHPLFLDLYAVPAGSRTLVYAFVQLNTLTGAVLAVSVALMSSLYGLRQVRAVTVGTLVSLGSGVVLTAALVGWLGVFALPAATATTATATAVWASRRLALCGVRPWARIGLRAPVRRSWREVCRISVPVSLGYLLLFGSGLVLTRILAGYSPLTVAGYGVAYRVQNLVLLPAIALGVGAGITVNRLAAQRRGGRVGPSVVAAVGLSAAVFAVVAALVWLLRGPGTGLLTGDPAVARAAADYLGYLAPAYLVAGPLLTLSIFLEETGNGVRALVVNATLTVVQLALAAGLARAGHPVSHVYLALAVAHLPAVGFVVHELLRARRLGGQVSAIPTS
ncbi:multi antimicrobial extrusion protein MatE [Micromonospora sp. L5]|uniref:MATE family efflux transporter n=1 Tax=Micromonospora sp. (strain L5) TaxID=648999 RepID=UPI0001C44FE7|nr:MATE family efflux transporter [Micromonospora sp. L5]ADU10037.1 multi antimicrobial extrusion protein MatE [Micromonospora sp. L5]